LGYVLELAATLADVISSLQNRDDWHTMRLVDICVSLIGLILTSPLLAVSAIAIKLDSKGPILFRQQRVGQNFKPFEIYKFRTMIVAGPLQGGLLTQRDDPRITKVGSFLRRWKIDELPQLFNVLKGDMSLVGPRPEVPKYVEMFRAQYADILTVRPGLTDPASIQFMDESKFLAIEDDPELQYVKVILPRKLKIAHDHLASRSLTKDLRLVMLTLWKLVRESHE
jgi:lipopolysaccharide/colanic/teichoic acid biosynthesis glycosyltransferase